MRIPPAYEIMELDSIDSTNLEAKRLIQAGYDISGKLVIIAKSQTGGRGRLGRNWVSQEGNLFVSVVSGQWPVVSGQYSGVLAPIPQETLATSHWPLLPFSTAIAVGNTIKSFTDSAVLYKWPNDVLVDGKKISGVLIEKMDNYAIIGVGINISSHPEEGTKLPATSLNVIMGKKIRVKTILQKFLQNLENALSLSEDNIISTWVQNAYGIGENIVVNQGENTISGRYVGIDSNGRLLLEVKRGKREAVLFGDVSWI